MNRPDKAGEPSMEEILASIRQIIADDPLPERGAIAVEPNPLVPQSASQNRKNEKSDATPASDVRAPLVDRLSDVLKNGQLPPTSPLGSKRPLSFDQDLADMFDDPADGEGASVPTPKPDMRLPLELSSSVSKPVPAAGAASAQPVASVLPKADALTNGAANSGADALSSQSDAMSLPPMPFGSAGPRPAEPAAPPPRSFGFPPLRKQSFYPPQPKTPELPPISSEAPPVKTAVPAEDADGGLEQALERLSGLGAVVPGQASSGVTGAEAAPSKSLSDADAGPGGSGFAPSTDAPDAKLESQATAAAPAPAFTSPAQPDKVSTVAPGFSSGSRSSPADLEAAFAPSPDRSGIAAQALDALAQGLAASAAASAVSAASSQPAIPLTPVVDGPQAGSAAASHNLPATTQAAAAGRTLEDAVADMLRPMLQQWVADNMPRIIEKALRVEVARTVKPGPSSGA
jgi:cell pole-organizing protein PopZ